MKINRKTDYTRRVIKKKVVVTVVILTLITIFAIVFIGSIDLRRQGLADTMAEKVYIGAVAACAMGYIDYDDNIGTTGIITSTKVIKRYLPDYFSGKIYVEVDMTTGDVLSSRWEGEVDYFGKEKRIATYVNTDAKANKKSS